MARQLPEDVHIEESSLVVAAKAMAEAYKNSDLGTLYVQRPQAPLRFIRLPEVLRRTGFCKAEIYARIREGTFPKSFALTKTRVAWVESEVVAWQEEVLRRAGRAA
jgi:prophage regulatory protein